MRVISIVPSRGSRASEDCHDTRKSVKSSSSRQSRQRRSSSPSRIRHPRAKHSMDEEDDDYRYEEEDDRRYRKSRRERWDYDEREAPPRSSSRRQSLEDEDDLVESRDWNRRRSKYDNRSSRSPSPRRPSSVRHFREEDEEESYWRRRPARTFPYDEGTYNKGRRQYPKEKWVPTPPELLREESDVGLVSVASSTDEYLKNCARYGKYQIDKQSLVEPKVLSYGGEEEDGDRYGCKSPPLLKSSSSESGIALWRSEDEEDDDDTDEPDWDMTMERALAVAVVATNPDDDDTLNSVEMINYDKSKAQILSHENRYDPMEAPKSESASLLGPRKEEDELPQEEEKRTKNKTKKKSKKKSKDKKAKKKNAKKGSKKGKKTKRDSSPGRKATPSPLPRPPVDASMYKETTTSALEINRSGTLSTISNSLPFTLANHESRELIERKKSSNSRQKKGVSFDDEELDRTTQHIRNTNRRQANRSGSRDSFSDDGDDDILRVESEESYDRYREKTRISHGKDSFDDESDTEDIEVEIYESRSEAESTTSGSYSIRAQLEFRKQKREEHRRWLQKRKKQKAKQPTLHADSSLESYPDWDDYDDEDRAKAVKVEKRRTQANALSPSHSVDRFDEEQKSEKAPSKAGLMGVFRRDDVVKDEDGKAEEEAAEEGPSPEPLPWEERSEKKEKKGFLKRAAALIRPKKHAVKSVDDLPFPNSDSLDGSLLDRDDKYKDVFDELPVLSPDGIKQPKQGPPDQGTVSSMSLTLPDRKRPLRRAKRGLGNRIKAIFLKP